LLHMAAGFAALYPPYSKMLIPVSL
jgi:hypothetical protein